MAIDVDSESYALKEIFDEPSTETSIQRELDFVRRAFSSGVRVPASHADREGRYLVTVPGHRWLRCYDWVDLQPVPVRMPDTPRQIGALLAHVHRCAPAAAIEPDGEPPYDWYHRVPAGAEWAQVAELSASAGASWTRRLAAAVSALPQLSAAVCPVEPKRLLLCHRDLHAENVFADGDGALVVVDFDDMGPAEPGRELVRMAFDWFCTATTADLDAVESMVEAYVDSGGPGRVSGPADFSMLIAARLNFLLEQLRLALDPKTERRQRDWAECEIEVHLYLLPTPRQLKNALAVMQRAYR